MNDPINLTTLIEVATFLGGLLVLWWRVENRVSKPATDAIEKAEHILSELNDFKLEVARNYPRYDVIKDVENRMGARFDAVVAEIHGMREDIQQAMVLLGSQKSQPKNRSSEW